MKEALYHGLVQPRVSPPGRPEQVVIALCKCRPPLGVDYSLAVPTVHMRLEADMLTYRGCCPHCGREHWAERAEAGVL